MKHIKKHPINDKAQKLSKDMKKQDLVKPKTDKKLDADDHLSDPKISKRYVKPSNKKLSSEKHLAGKKAKKVNEASDYNRAEQLSDEIVSIINSKGDLNILDEFEFRTKLEKLLYQSVKTKD